MRGPRLEPRFDGRHLDDAAGQRHLERTRLWTAASNREDDLFTGGPAQALQAIAQALIACALSVDPGDPINYVAHIGREPFAGQAPRPLLANMEGSALDKYQPIPDKEPKVTAHVRAMLQALLDGTLKADDFTAEAWNDAAPGLKDIQTQVKALGPLVSVTLVDRSEEGGKRSYRYRMEFEKNTLLQRLVFDEQNKLAASETEDVR